MDSMSLKNMTPKELNTREVQILQQIPKPQLEDFIERNGQKMRDILEDDEWHSNLEIIEMLLLGYSGL